MTMTTISNENRTGIYVQKSTEATTVGDGLAPPEGDKSPVVKNNESENHSDNTQNRASESQERNTEEPSTNLVDDDENEIEEEDNNKEDENELNTNDGVIDYKRLNRTARIKVLQTELKKLGFSLNEIRIMKRAMEDERKNYQNNKKLMRLCEETNKDPEVLQAEWAERKGRETAKYKAVDGEVIRTSVIRERQETVQKPSEFSKPGPSNPFIAPSPLNPPPAIKQNKKNPLKNPPIFTSPGVLAGIEADHCTYNRKGNRIKRNYTPYKYKVTLPNHSLTSDEFLKIVGKQNNLPTDLWTVTCKKPWNNMFKAWYLVDTDSHEYLKDSNNYVYFMFGQIRFKFCADNPTDD